MGIGEKEWLWIDGGCRWTVDIWGFIELFFIFFWVFEIIYSKEEGDREIDR